MARKAESFIRYSVLVHKEGNQYSSWCPELDVASAGDNVEDACANLEQAVNELVSTYAELGELTQFLAERGISLEDSQHCPSLFLSEARVSVPAIS